jgi:hypothetical protein
VLQNWIPVACNALTQALPPLVRLTQPEIDSIVAEVPGGAANVQDIYPLAPLQENMRFHQLLQSGSGVDVEQLVSTLAGGVEDGVLREAWQRVLDCHDALRTSLNWKGVSSPVQVVGHRVELPFRVEDWRGLDASRCAARMEEFLQVDRQRGFRLHEAPLLRITLIHLTADAPDLVWTFHHAILDGRSFPIVLTEVFAVYEALLNGRVHTFERRRPYRKFIAWLGGVEAQRAQPFWREWLRGFHTPTPPADRISSSDRLPSRVPTGSRGATAVGADHGRVDHAGVSSV